ncbi:putative 50s ribosomal protein [Phaeomoniella chlamydospora]|uniref:Large ribosomal subunit protein bL27m n=1 Tax=Phaeomoniella chlamydospora TaxID=158046 RepID=A0A0G2FWQ4_PHACM|nr:putative 50s ribosomal protein [Phaeomoniella chlamydospora]
MRTTQLKDGQMDQKTLQVDDWVQKRLHQSTKWHPGENVGIGRDHTIYATETGYVRYYRDPDRHPKRRYIGVALEREGPESALPTPKNAATRRRLNMLAVPRQKAAKEGDLSFTATITDSLSSAETSEAPSTSQNTRSRYMYREANWEIGRAAERKGITKNQLGSNLRDGDQGAGGNIIWDRRWDCKMSYKNLECMNYHWPLYSTAKEAAFILGVSC